MILQLLFDVKASNVDEIRVVCFVKQKSNLNCFRIQYKN